MEFLDIDPDGRVTKARRVEVVPTEDSEQEALFQWAERAACTMPELRLLFAVANGGYRHPATAARMKRTGVRAGVPDMLLPVAREGWNGLFIELKRRKGGVVSVNQKEWIRRLAEQGYKVAVCKGWEEAKDEIEGYLG
jgi:hypothetical protein